MNRWALYIVAIVVGTALVLFTCTYQVRFNEKAILTTLGRAGENAQVAEPGLHWKWPYPVQSIQKYDTRTKVLVTKIENVSTADKQLLAAQVFLTWRISDPLAFYRRLETDQKAQNLLDQRLRSGLGAFGEFSFSDMLLADPTANKLDAVEDRLLAYLASPRDNSEQLSSYGIQAVDVGVSRFILPDNTSKQVFERMKQTRQRLAAEERSSGDAEAARIRAKARTDARRIREFASALAASIRARGEQEAAALLGQQSQTPEGTELAVFLRQLEAFEKSIQAGATLVLPAVLPPFQFLKDGPMAGIRPAYSTEADAARNRDSGGH